MSARAREKPRHDPRCTLAAWHHPWFSSGLESVNDAVQPLFQALYDNGVYVLLTGHDHGYERFAPMDASANRDGARGVRQFVVGTGGKDEEMQWDKPKRSDALTEEQQQILAQRGNLTPEAIHKLAHKGKKAECHSDVVAEPEKAKLVQINTLKAHGVAVNETGL